MITRSVQSNFIACIYSFYSCNFFCMKLTKLRSLTRQNGGRLCRKCRRPTDWHLTEYAAKEVFAAFGGVKKLQLGFLAIRRPRSPSSFYRWLLPVEKGGTGGFIPKRSLYYVRLAAKTMGVDL
jgi:hypothetical protein